MGTLRSTDRLAAAVGLLGAAPLEFAAVDDVPMGGVLCALPALMSLAWISMQRNSHNIGGAVGSECRGIISWEIRPISTTVSRNIASY